MTTSAIHEYIEAVKNGKLQPKEYIEDLLSKLKEQNSKSNIFSNFANMIETSSEGDLQGIPFTVKDNICVRKSLTRAGSKILDGYRPPFDATVVSRMRAAGAIFIGSTNMDEFGFGTFSTNCAFGAPKNPFDSERSCGGSSGGAAAATTVMRHHVALAESTGGSISCPASFCGVVGFTPTYGRVSRYGLIDYANSLDKIGLMSRSVEDIAHVLPIISGKDPKDFTSLAQPELDISDREIKSIAIPEELVDSIPDAKILAMFNESIKKLEELGIESVKVSMPILRFSIPAYYILACAEASTNLAKFCGMRYGKPAREYNRMFNEFFTEVRTENFGTEAKRRIMLGTFARMAGYRDQYYMKALRVRRKIIERFEEVFEEYDLIATPTMPLLPPRFEEIQKMSPATVYALDFLTVPPNLAGIPQISMPMGYIENLPVGIHFLADHWEESKLISVGKIWETQVEHRFPENLGWAL
ncbi:MAG: aspartyl/glutamyl-tRNA amidotransferase subunit A [Thermoplasmata archaeon]|nr:aspartyl/glutamyl-tRNA amidotransferase subunit A [Thermoplasmata archaeon]